MEQKQYNAYTDIANKAQNKMMHTARKKIAASR